MKTCFKCKESKPLTEFYKHGRMADGLLGKCKQCTKNDAQQHRAENLEKVKAYDRQRGNLPHRVAARKEYASSEQGKAAQASGSKAWADRNPDRRKASTEVSNALRDGRLIKQPCFVCGDKNSDGHHPAYSLPLAVTWLCRKHHTQLHKEHREHERRSI